MLSLGRVVHGPGRRLTGAFVGTSTSRRRLTVTAAHLPHLDEEIEHLQWQIAQRRDEGRRADRPAATRPGSKQGTARAAPQQPAKQRVFHGHRTAKHHGAHAARRQQHHSAAPSQHTPGSGPGSGAYHHLVLHSGAPLDLPKAAGRLARHIAADGGAYVSAAPSEAGALSDLLLALQHAQPSGHVLVLQAAECGEPDAAGHARAPAAAAASRRASSGGGSGTIVQPGRDALCAIGGLHLFVSQLRGDALLALQRDTCCDHACGLGALPGGGDGGSWQSLSFDAGVGASSSSSSSSSSSWDSGGAAGGSRRDEAAAAVAAAAAASSSLGALLLQAAARGCLAPLRVGAHAEPGAVAARVAAALSAGAMAALRVKGQAPAHAAALAALQLAAEAAGAGASPAWLAVLLPGARQAEHVHAEPHHHGQGHVSRGAPAMDASMAMAGISQSLYGVGAAAAAPGAAPGEAVRVTHTHEVWLGVMPLHDAGGSDGSGSSSGSDSKGSGSRA